jgi:hypothetical protein
VSLSRFLPHLLTSACGTKRPKPMRYGCPQLAKADVASIALCVVASPGQSFPRLVGALHRQPIWVAGKLYINPMGRTYLVFGDIEGKVDMLRVECKRCGRQGRYSVRKLIEKYGRKGHIMKWKQQLNGDCPIPARAGANAENAETGALDDHELELVRGGFTLIELLVQEPNQISIIMGLLPPETHKVR